MKATCTTCVSFNKSDLRGWKTPPRMPMCLRAAHEVADCTGSLTPTDCKGVRGQTAGLPAWPVTLGLHAALTHCVSLLVYFFCGLKISFIMSAAFSSIYFLIHSFCVQEQYELVHKAIAQLFEKQLEQLESPTNAQIHDGMVGPARRARRLALLRGRMCLSNTLRSLPRGRAGGWNNTNN